MGTKRRRKFKRREEGGGNSGRRRTKKDVPGLDVGDVIRLDRGSNDDLLLCINQRPKFFCRPGRVRDKIAVCVNEAVADEEAIKGFGL